MLLVRVRVVLVGLLFIVLVPPLVLALALALVCTPWCIDGGATLRNGPGPGPGPAEFTTGAAARAGGDDERGSDMILILILICMYCMYCTVERSRSERNSIESIHLFVRNF